MNDLDQIENLIANQGEQLEYTVSEISALIKKSIEQNFGYVKIRGEVSGLKIAPSGHVYFSLKDEGAVISAICWRGAYASMQHKPEDGMEIICFGNLTTYPGRSSYQIIVQSAKPAGVGALMALLEKRKKQFQDEGLFDSAHKKPIPFLPNTIGVITSPTGAVIQDIIHRIEDRFPSHILLWPVLVQGDKAAEQIKTAIDGFNKLAEKPNVIIIARGGGSIEDLWPFNEDIVVRAAFASQIPIISAVGHETDTTLIDYVADVRAPTPTAAAEMAVPVRRDLMMAVADLGRRKRLACLNYLDNKKTMLLSSKTTMTNLGLVIANYAQKVDEVAFRLIEASLRHHSNLCMKLELFKKVLSLNFISLYIEGKSKELNAVASLLHSYDYKNVLRRGFALLRDDSNRVLKSAKEMERGKKFLVEMHDGTKDAQFS